MFAFGLSEKAHGADIYSTDMILTPRDEGVYSADEEAGILERLRDLGYE